MNRSIRKYINTALTVTGMAMVLTTFLYESTLGYYVRFMIVVLGLAVLEIGIWGLSSSVLPSERKFYKLRQEGDTMLDLIRQLNATAVSKNVSQENTEKFQDTLQEMHNSVIRMLECAADQD